MKKQKLKARGPRPSLHSTGQWRVRFDCRAFYLGTDEDSAMERFYELRKQWKAGTLPDKARPKTIEDLAAERAQLTVRSLVQQYHEHLRNDQDAGWLERNESDIRRATNLLVKLHGRDLANVYGPRRLKQVQAHLCSLKRTDATTPRYTHKTVNEKVRRLVDVFRHAVSEELVPPLVLEALRAVKPVRRGKPGTRDCRVVTPATQDQVEAVLPYLNKTLATAIQLLWHTGARPSELLKLRPCDIDRSRNPWRAVLVKHKTARSGKRRVLRFGQASRPLLEPLLLRPADTPIFTPTEGAADANHRRRAQRTTPLWPAHERRYERDKAKRPRQTFSETYDACALNKALQRAIARCNKDRNENGQPLVPRWFTYQLRHSTATRIRKAKNIDASQLILGHESRVTTEIYADPDESLADEVAELLC